MKVTKLHGLGNDFIVFFDENGKTKDYTDMAIKWCNRNTGIGADGLVIVVPSDVADVRMRIINSDGSEAEMCGNGVRCFAKYAYDRGLIKTKQFAIETLAGIIKPEVIVENGKVTQVKVDMGKPVFKSTDIPINDDAEKVLHHDITIEGVIYDVASVRVGVPHTEVFVTDITTAPLKTHGPLMEKHVDFPQHTNVNFVEVVNDHHIKVRTWERGAGATLACGTGSCAAVVMSHERGFTGRSVDVELYLGILHIDYMEDGTIFMTGPAEEVFDTDIEI